MIVNQWLRRPVVCVGVRMAWASCRRGPSRPAEKRCQPTNIIRIANGAGPQAKLRTGFSKECRVVGSALFKRMYLSIGVRQRSSGSVILVRLEVLYRVTARRVRTLTTVELDTRKLRAMQVFSCEIRSKIRAMSKDRTVFHQAIAQEDFLASHNIVASKQDSTVCALNYFRNRRLVIIGVVSEHAHNEESDDQDDGCCLNPAARDHQRTLYNRMHRSLLA